VQSQFVIFSLVLFSSLSMASSDCRYSSQTSCNMDTAVSLLTGSTKNGVIEESQINKVVSELDAIQKFNPVIRNFYYQEAKEFYISLELEDRLDVIWQNEMHLYPATKLKVLKKYTDNTGKNYLVLERTDLPMLDSINSTLPIWEVRIPVDKDGGALGSRVSIEVVFKDAVDLSTISRLYQKVPGVEYVFTSALLHPVSGSEYPDEIVRVESKEGLAQYGFYQAEINKAPFYFEVNWKNHKPVVKEVSVEMAGSPKGVPLFGLAGRHDVDLEMVTSFNELKSYSENKDWWVRLFAAHYAWAILRNNPNSNDLKHYFPQDKVAPDYGDVLNILTKISDSDPTPYVQSYTQWCVDDLKDSASFKNFQASTAWQP
jgi:hypothetical protein